MDPQAKLVLARLARGIRRCRRCSLHLSRTNAVPGEGPASAAVMFIGEAPGLTEDRTGRPFVGRSGRMLNLMLARLGLDRDSVFITSSVKCRPPDNRVPLPDELAVCKRNWLDRQIDAVNPRLIVLLGRVAVRQVLGLDAPMANLHGRFFKAADRSCAVTYHPAAVMRFSTIRRQAWQDLSAIRRML